LEVVLHPAELVALLKYKFFYNLPPLPSEVSPSQQYCYRMLSKVSRSFAAVIRELHPELREPVCLFYLILRGLDTVEDDMSVPVDKKIVLLNKFHEQLRQAGWKTSGYGTAHEKDLLENFDKVIEVYQSIKPEYQAIISDITMKMGRGMAEFALKEVVTHAEYEKYCYYVAGLVGIGLSRMFAVSGLEDKSLETADEISNSMGLFLQKVNIIRDYLEDINESPPRIFYPREVWSKYATKFEDFKEEQYSKEAVACLNDMITDAMKHIPDCLEYMAKLRNQEVFNFCAIPQVMAIATLAKCYNNHDVFTGVVKIRKGLAVKMIIEAKNLKSVCRYFGHFTSKIGKSIPLSDPNAEAMRTYVARTKELVAAQIGDSY
jgi:farnesyl-diphosphate farnesyltransferase